VAAGLAASGGGPAGAADESPGVTAKTVTVGTLDDLTGPLAFWGTVANKAFKARIAQENAAGGVNGRKIVVVTADGTSTPTGENSGAKNLVESHHVFAVASDTILTAAVANYLYQQGVPVTGGGVEASRQWAQLPNMFDVLGNIMIPKKGGQYTTFAGFFKTQPGVKKVGALGYGDEPGSVDNTKAFATGARAVGLDPAYIDTSSSIGGGFNPAGLLLGAKQAGVQGLNLQLTPQDSVTFLTALKQAGLQIVVASSGYGESFIKDPKVAAAADGSYVWSFQTPAELKTPATENETAALKKYAGLTGPPDLAATMGWTAADLMIKGLQVAGPNLTRSTFMKKLRAVGGYDANGLMNYKVNMFDQKKNIPKFCLFFSKIQNGKFVPAGTKPVCGRVAG
jgi:ABC-type branched-subunit amino acid transport system substrate-binding protein